MKIKAYAKVNLALDVLGKREDGYHDLDMIMCPIDLYDDIVIVRSDRDNVTCDMSIPEENTVTKAIKSLREHYEFLDYFDVKIEKHIPMQAGLAGGSADAAAVIWAIVKMLRLEYDEENLIEIGKEIGADVPFCLIGKVARVKGIGDVIEPFDSHLSLPCLLIRPDKGVDTAKAFKSLKEPIEHPNITAIRDAMIAGDYDSFIRNIGNSLEGSAFTIVPEIEVIKKELIAMGFDGSTMTGSGSTVMGFTRDKGLLERAVQRYKHLFTYVTIL